MSPTTLRKIARKLFKEYNINYSFSIVTKNEYINRQTNAIIDIRNKIICFNKNKLKIYSNKRITSILKHEVAHALAYQRYGERWHGERWRRVCNEIGVLKIDGENYWVVERCVNGIIWSNI